jgi:periplasmic protein CpxP/Spy
MNKIHMLIALSSLAVGCAAQPERDSHEPGQASDTAPGMQQMQSRMREMQALMGRIHETQDPAERHRLMQEHMQSMRQGMAAMGRIMDAPMEPGRDCPQADAECRMQGMQRQQQMMNQRMGMMQMMMGQMMQRDAEQSTAKPADPEDHDAHH